MICVVAPVTPTELKATNLSNSKVQLSWSLADTHADQQPSSLSLLLTNLTHFSSSEMKLRGSVTNQNVVVVPGMRYRAILTSHNQDGEISTLPIEFRAATACESLFPIQYLLLLLSPLLMYLVYSLYVYLIC